jgi:hypothetical protein
MNISLTWANYALIIGACLIGYYFVIGFVYYRKDLRQIFQSKKEPVSCARSQQLAATIENNYQFSLPSDTSGLDNIEMVNDKSQNVQPTIEDFMDEIYACTQACGNNITKEELEKNLRKILYKYPSLTSSSLRSVLAGIIAAASETHCSIQWREDELSEWWNG